MIDSNTLLAGERLRPLGHLSTGGDNADSEGFQELSATGPSCRFVQVKAERRKNIPDKVHRYCTTLFPHCSAMGD